MRRRPKKRVKKRRGGRRRELENRLRRKYLRKFPDQEVVVGLPDGDVKMSEVVEQFVEPFKEAAATRDAYRTLLFLGIIAWNTTFLPEKQRKSDLQIVFQELPDETRDDGREIVDYLIKRKETPLLSLQAFDP